MELVLAWLVAQSGTGRNGADYRDLYPSRSDCPEV